jgi:gas vesicle protein
MSKQKTTIAFIGGAILGGAVGTIFGLLTAPRSGRETRQLLKKSADALPDLAEDLSTSVQLQTDRLSESALRNWDGTLNRLKEAIAAGIEASQQEANFIKKSSDLANSGNPSSADKIAR